MTYRRDLTLLTVVVMAGVMAGCPAPTPVLPASGDPAPSTSATATVSVSSTPSAPIPSPSPMPSPDSSHFSDQVGPAEVYGMIKGRVANQDDVMLDGATITATVSNGAKFANGSAELTVKAVGGSYELTGVPLGTPVVVTATTQGAPASSQSTVLLSNPSVSSPTNTVNFTLYTL